MIDDDASLFPATAAAPPPGEAERALEIAVAAGRAAGTIVDEDAALIAAARITARALDAAGRVMGPKTIYAVAQALTPYREALHALRLPAAIAPAGAKPPTPAAGGGGSLSDLFGSPGA